MPMEKRAICAPKSIPLFLHSNEEATCPATTHLLAPLAMRYGHVTNFSPPGCEKRCVWFPGLVNKLPQQVHSSMFILSFCELGWRWKPPECPGSYFLKMTERQLAWVPEKLCGASPLLLCPALNSWFRLSWEKEPLLCSRRYILGLFVTQATLNTMANIRLLSPLHPDTFLVSAET